MVSAVFAPYADVHLIVPSPFSLSHTPPPHPHSYSFPKEEEQVLQLWDRLDAFKEQLRRSEGKPEYIFFDGPPFATGLPHYGHILAGTLKVRQGQCGPLGAVNPRAASHM